MKALIQVVKDCTLEVNKRLVSEIDYGILAYIGISRLDSKEDIIYIKNKILNLRIFEDENQKMNLCIKEIPNTKLMLVSQFTLYGDCKKGNRPSYDEAMAPNDARSFFEDLVKTFKENKEIEIETGIFGKDMSIRYTNLGPRSFIIKSKERKNV